MIHTSRARERASEPNLLVAKAGRTHRTNVARYLAQAENTFVPTHANEFAHRPTAFATHVLPAAVYASAIFYGGLIRLAALPEVGFIATDKLLHALVFGGLALLLARALHFLRPKTSLSKKLALGCAAASLIGLLLEVCQSCTLYRSGDPWDWLADTVGALLANGVAFGVLAWRPRREDG